MNDKAIQALIGTGADAATNLFDVFITFPWDDAETVMVRADGFAVPNASNGGYDIKYHGNTLKRPITEVTFNRTFELNFRSDAAYALHASFIKWQQAVVDPVNGGIGNYPAALGKVKVRALAGNYTAAEEGKTLVDDAGAIKSSETNPVWTFDQVWVADVKQPSFSSESASQFKFGVTFYFGDTDYPFYNGAGISGTDTTNI